MPSWLIAEFAEAFDELFPIKIARNPHAASTSSARSETNQRGLAAIVKVGGDRIAHHFA
ncbi:MAG: hypothetical protein H6637_01145 [Ardenticatenales bacterium]|nr:hypothetical protein [Ardenticatenales bacterium]